MKLNELKKEIPYRWRVQSFSKNKPKASCVAYIDARDVMDLLDEVVGAENWQSDFKSVDNRVFAGVGIKVNDEWVWKWDTGAETQVEAEKGEASDAFKRAAVKWGIGRFLYSLEIKYVDTNGAKSDSHKYPHVIDANGRQVWNLTEHINGKGASKSNDTAKAKKGRIHTLMLSLGHEGYTADKLKQLTQLDPEPKNYDEIINRLSILQQEQEHEAHLNSM